MRAGRRNRLLLALALAVAMGGASCSRDKGAQDGPVGTITDVRGTVDLISDGETRKAVEQADLFTGDAVRINGSGSARFTLGGDGTYQLVRGRAQVQGTDSIRLADSVLLVSSDKPVEADLEAVKVAFGKGTVRAELGAPGRIAAYDVEGLQVTAGSQKVDIPPLWQVSVSPEGALEQGRPLQFSRDDPVDAIHLAHALDADAKLGNLLRGLEPQLAATDGSALRKRLASAGIGPGTLAPFAGEARSDQLMGLAFAREWRSAELVRSFEQAMTLKALGATWGLIAQSLDVNADALVASLQNEITAVLFAGGAAESGQLVPSPPRSQRSPGSGTRRPGGEAPRAPAAPGPPPAAPPPGGGEPGSTPTPGLVGPIVDPLRPLLPNELEAIIDELYGLVDGLVPLL